MCNTMVHILNIYTVQELYMQLDDTRWNLDTAATLT